jgi:hypothetical protein
MIIGFILGMDMERMQDEAFARDRQAIGPGLPAQQDPRGNELAQAALDLEQERRNEQRPRQLERQVDPAFRIEHEGQDLQRNRRRNSPPPQQRREVQDQRENRPATVRLANNNNRERNNSSCCSQ